MISECTFVERVVIEVYVYLWFLQRVWATDRFEHLKWRRLKNMELKSIIILSILVVVPIQGIFDSTWIYLKYQEGFSPVIYDRNGTYSYSQLQNSTWFPKPYNQWTNTNYRIKNITEYLLCISFALQTGTLLLVQLFWSHLAGHWGRSFLVSSEFKVYIVWIFMSMIIFPLSRRITNDSFPYTEIVPQMIFATDLLIICLVGLRNQRKLCFLLRSVQRQELQESTSQETTLQINYFSEMNMLLSVGTLLISIPFLILGIDALTKKTINSSRFISDLLIVHCNFGALILWIIMILITYPRYYLTGLFGSKFLSKKSLSRISHISSGLTFFGGGNIMNTKGYRNFHGIPEYGQHYISNRSSIRSSTEQQQFGTSIWKTSTLDPSIPFTRSSTSSPRNSTLQIHSKSLLPLNLQNPPPSMLSSTSMVNLSLNRRGSSPLPPRSSTNSLPSNLGIHSKTSSPRLAAFAPDHRRKSPANSCDDKQMSSASSSYADDDVSYRSCIDSSYVGKWSDDGNFVDSDDNKDEKDYKQQNFLRVSEDRNQQLQEETSSILEFQLTPPLRPKDHPKDHVIIKSWI